MTVSELISALQDLIIEDDIGSNIAQMQVWINHYGEPIGEASVGGVEVSEGRVWL
jgi:hypothetical protein